MPPKAEEALDSDQKCWPKGGRPALRKARAAAVKKKENSYTADVPKSGGGTKPLTFYINYAMCPIILERDVNEFTGAKQEQRPHKQARKQEKKSVRSALIAQRHQQDSHPLLQSRTDGRRR